MKKLCICIVCISFIIGCNEKDDLVVEEYDGTVHIYSYYKKSVFEQEKFVDIGTKAFVYFNLDIGDGNIYYIDDEGTITYTTRTGEKRIKHKDIDGGVITSEDGVSVTIPPEQVDSFNSYVIHSCYCNRYLGMAYDGVRNKTFINAPFVQDSLGVPLDEQNRIF